MTSEDEDEELLRQAIAISMEGTDENDKSKEEDEELLNQAIALSLEVTEENDKREDEEELLKLAIAMSLTE